jgi:hypothetical protein
MILHQFYIHTFKIFPDVLKKSPSFLLGSFMRFYRAKSATFGGQAVFLLGLFPVYSAGTEKIQEIPNQSMNSATPSLDMRGQTIEKGDIGTLFISGSDVRLILEEQKANDLKINLNTNATAQLGKKRTSLKLLRQDNQTLQGKILVPSGMRVVIEGGSVDVTIQGFVGELSVAAGSARIAGQGKLSRFTLVSGESSVKLQGLMGQTQMHCGKGDVQVGFVRESYENISDLVIPSDNNEGGKNKYISSGLRLHYPAVKITINLANGQATLIFPKDVGVNYPKENSRLKSLFVPHQSKRAPYRIFPYISGSASLTLRNDLNGAADGSGEHNPRQ